MAAVALIPLLLPLLPAAVLQSSGAFARGGNDSTGLGIGIECADPCVGACSNAE